MISIVGGRFAMVERGSSSVEVIVLLVLNFFSAEIHIFLAFLVSWCWCCNRFISFLRIDEVNP